MITMMFIMFITTIMNYLIISYDIRYYILLDIITRYSRYYLIIILIITLWLFNVAMENHHF